MQQPQILKPIELAALRRLQAHKSDAEAPEPMNAEQAATPNPPSVSAQKVQESS